MKYEVQLGHHISHACVEACHLARRRNEAVEFTFNGIDVTVRPGEDAGAVEKRWANESERRHNEWKSSSEGKRREAEQRAEGERCRRECVRLIGQLPLVLHDLRKTVAWVRDFCEPADHVDAKPPLSKIADAFEKAGWLRGAHVGVSPESFTNQMRGEYIIGQAIDCMR